MERKRRKKRILISCSMILILLLGAGSRASQTEAERKVTAEETNQSLEKETMTETCTEPPEEETEITAETNEAEETETTAETNEAEETETTTETSEETEAEITAETDDAAAEIPADENEETTAERSADDADETATEISEEETAETSAEISEESTEEADTEISEEEAEEADTEIIEEETGETETEIIEEETEEADTEISEEEAEEAKTEITEESTEETETRTDGEETELTTEVLEEAAAETNTEIPSETTAEIPAETLSEISEEEIAEDMPELPPAEETDAETFPDISLKDFQEPEALPAEEAEEIPEAYEAGWYEENPEVYEAEDIIEESRDEKEETESKIPAVHEEQMTLRGGYEEVLDTAETVFFSSGIVKAALPEEGTKTVCRVVRYSRDGTVLEEKYLDHLHFDGEEAAFSFMEEGKWQIFTQTEDEQGNIRKFASPMIQVDKTAPLLEITGVSEDSSNNGKLSIRVSCRDDWYQDGTLSVELEGASGKSVDLVDRVEKVPGGAEIYLKDLPMDPSYDDHYVLRVCAQDLAGNKAQSEMNFCVNRGGSSYLVAEETGKKLEEYYHSQPFPIILQEINLDSVRASSLRAVKEGKAFLLQEGTDYTVKSEVMEDGKIRNSYEIHPDVFASDGSYQIMLVSEDMANNLGDSVSGGVTVRFAIDREKPECLIHGMERGEVIEGENRWISIELLDNMKVEQAEIYLNGLQTAAYSALEIEKMGSICKIELGKKDEWQNLQVVVSDAAGNQYSTGEIPFYLSSPPAQEGIFPNPNKRTLPGSMAGSGSILCLILTAAGLAVLYVWRRKDVGKNSG